MEKVTLYIKNMVCPRCVMVVKDELRKVGVEVKKVTLGKAVIVKPDNVEMKTLSDAMKKFQFRIIESPDKAIVEQIKITIIEQVHHSKNPDKKKNSVLLEEKIGKSYRYLSRIFSANEGVTIEKYTILQKIEKVKELLEYGEHTLSEIAMLLNYSSVHALSSQFKQITGTPVREYKSSNARRKYLNDV